MGLRGNRTSRQQQYMSEKVTGQTGRGHSLLWLVAEQQVPADGHWQQPTHWGGGRALLQPHQRNQQLSSCHHLFQQNKSHEAQHCAGSTSLPQGRANTVRGRAELALLAAQRASKEAPFAMAVPSSAHATTQVVAGGLFWIGGTLQPQKSMA